MSALLLWVFAVAPASAHAGHGPAEPWAVCAEATLGDPCSWENAAHDVYRGTCRSMSDALVCVRNQPIVPRARSSSLPIVSVGLGVALGLAATTLWRQRRSAPVG